MRCYFSNKKFIAGISIISFVFLTAVIGVFYTPCDPYNIDIPHKLQFVSSSHILGTDNLGRDIASRIIVGYKLSLSIGFIASLFGFIAGGFIGSVGGYLGGAPDCIVRKIIDVMMSFPGILLSLLFIAIMGSGWGTTVFSLCIMSIPRFARITRGSVSKLRKSFFVLSLKSRGASYGRIIFMHILPNIKNELLVTFTFNFAYAVTSEAGLTYLGLGVSPPSPSFGRLISDGGGQILTHPWVALFPVISFVLPIVALMMIGDSLHEKKELYK